MESRRPLITIITPVYNAGAYIAQCIENVQSQLFADFEHLIVDGLSIDNTLELVKTYQNKYSNIRVLSEKDNGVYDAMNKGIRSANSSWLYFLGADDYFYDENVLRKISTYLVKSDDGIIYGDVYYKGLERVYDGLFDAEKILRHNVGHQAIFYHESVFSKIGCYNLKYRTEADYDFNLRCWLNGDVRTFYVPITIAYYETGGISSGERDHVLVRDYPANTVSIVLESRFSFFDKVLILSKIYRKIGQRYSPGILFNSVVNTKQVFLRVLAYMWSMLTIPFYIIKRMKKLS